MSFGRKRKIILKKKYDRLSVSFLELPYHNFRSIMAANIYTEKKKTTARVHQQMFDLRVNPSLLTFLQHKYTSKERYAD